MEAKIVFVFCFQLMYLKYAYAQCIGAAISPELANERIMPNTAMPGPFTNQITMQIPSLPAPSFSIFSDGLVVDGLVSVTGSMPFLGTVTLGGSVPANGYGNVMYSCGNGEVGIETELPNGPVMSELYRSNPLAWNNANGLIC